MKSKLSPGGTAGLIMGILLTGFALYEFNAAKKAEAALAIAHQERQVDRARLQELTNDARNTAQMQVDQQRAREQAAPRATAATPETAANVDAAQLAAAKAADAAKAKATALADGQAFLTAYGQSREMLMEIGRAQVRRNYSFLALASGLTPAQVEAFETQTAEHWIKTVTLTPKSITPGEPEMPQSQLKEILGDQGFEQFQNYKRIQPLQGLVTDISTLATFAPLTPEQSIQLLNIMAGASSSYQSGGRAEPQSIDWNQVVAQAQGILSETQLNAVKAEAQLPQIMVLVKQFYQNHPAPK